MSHIRARLRSFLFRRRLDREMREEMQAHLAMATERLVARGFSPEEARRQALREFGNVAYIQEMGRDERGGGWVSGVLADLAFGVRHFARTPFATTTLLFLLVLGIGPNVALFTFAHALLTRPAAGIPPDDALVRIRGLRLSRESGTYLGRGMSPEEVAGYAGHEELFTAVVPWATSTVTLTLVGQEEGTWGSATYVGDGYFDLLGVRPVMGGLPPTGGDPLSDPAAVISHSLWEQDFGADPEVVGRTFRANRVTVTVVGVAPPRFAGVNDGRSRMIWLPYEARSSIEATDPALPTSDFIGSLNAVARLRPGVTLDRASAVALAVARGAGFSPDPRAGEVVADVVPLRLYNATPTDSDDLYVFSAVVAVGLILLLVTCMNVSVLLVGLSARRKHEIAVRLSLGASRARLVRQLVTETGMLTVTGGALVLALVWTLVEAFGARFQNLEIVLAWPVLILTAGIAATTTVVFGLSPALYATRAGLSEVLKDSARAVSASRSRLQSMLVIGQISLAQPLLVLLAVTGLNVLGEWRHARPGSELDEHVIMTGFILPPGNSRDQLAEDVDRLRTRVLSLPGAVAAAAEGLSFSFALAAHPADRPAGTTSAGIEARAVAALPGYFDVVGAKLVQGRDFLQAERKGTGYPGEGGPIVIGSEIARGLWGSADPIGRRLVVASEAEASDRSVWGVVVGVVDGAGTGLGDSEPSRSIYLPGSPFVTGLLVRTAGPAEAFIPTLRSVANAELPATPITTTTVAGIKRRDRREINQAAAGTAGAGLLALLLSVVGLYAVVSFGVTQRTREIGVRRALGAQESTVVGHFFVRGLRLSGIGLGVGLPLSLIALRIFSATVPVGEPSFPVVAAVTTLGMLAVASLATWLPARRAAGVDPLIALRAE